MTIVSDYYFAGLSDELLGKIRKAAPGIEITSAYLDTVTADELIGSEIVYGRVPPQILRDLKNLKWIHLASAGANGLTDLSLYPNHSVILTKSSGTFGIPISEHIIGMMIALSRHFGQWYENMDSSRWNAVWSGYREIYESNVLVLGVGDLGTEVCWRLSNFGCRVTGFRKDTSIPHELFNDIRPLSRLHESLPDADYIIICLPGTVETEKLIGREEFALMKNSAVIINVGRGMIIDTDALVEALYANKIGGAGLDVTDPEPLPPDHPLWKAPNVLITPHVSAGSDRNNERRVDIFCDLLRRYISGQELHNKVDFTAGY